MSTEETPVYTPRYLAYCATEQRTPAAMLEHDRQHWPGGHMCGFTLWIASKWREWRTARGLKRDHILSAEDHADFDRWIAP
jgi:hypothetical protein